MEYIGYKLVFSTAVHFGEGNLEDSGNKLYADTIFSALCHEAVSLGCIDKLISCVQNSNVKLSDAFPFIDDTYYVPKPMVSLDSDKSADDKKKTKKLEYISGDLIYEYLNGSMDIVAESEKLAKLGISDIRTQASINANEDTRPYSVGTYTFSENAGLYLIIGYNDEEGLHLIRDLLISLSFTGIGGKRSSGLGKFELHNATLPDCLIKKISDAEYSNRVMSLSIGMCEDEELEDICRNARYLLSKRSGFISSSTYANKLVKKQDSYLFRSGSIFSKPFTGIIRDVSIKGTHPVYCYANPIFMEVSDNE
ncbi:type III-A CRISPR-associated RAMP protein Csm4 [Mogibacterium timidum]|uniref:CRISPR system Cms protein Csm4 n=1 Tax=Mogibacterium timidum TaxID=35519 RepID=A0A7Y8VRZ8_9FIRM|nr:type III-A CRISPR-associated RAMP protein Csm4 [Mogibacterium timidum]NWO23580.1 type III-A CRISPR-associated RAMP protein Csm4 [Mogibacterium timidum]